MTTTKIPAEFLEAITGSEITDGGIGTADIADLGVTTAKIANNAITAAKLPDNVITATHIPDGLITGTHIAGTTITATQIANNAVGTDQLAGIARGKIIYGDSNGDPQLLTIGSNGTVLKSDGTDVSWGTAAVAGISSSADATAITIGADESVDFAKGVVVLGSGTTAGVYLNGTNSDSIAQGNFVRYGTNFLTQSNAANSSLITYAFNGSTFVNALNVKSDGDVGIGTTNPLTTLHVEIDNSNDQLFIADSRAYNTSTLGGILGFGGKYNSSSNITTWAQIHGIKDNTTDGSFAGHLRFATRTTGALTERMRIDSSGRLLIGETSNNDGAAVQIDANSAGATVYSLRIENSNTATDVYNGIRLIQGASGSAVGVMATGGSTTGNVSYRNVFHVGTQNATPLVLGTNDTERMRIDSSGNVGIGNTSMSSYDSNARNLVVGSGTGDEGMTIASGSGSGGRLYFADGTSSDAEKADGYIFYNHASQYMAFGIVATERLRIESGGNLLVGTTSNSTGRRVHIESASGGSGQLGLRDSAATSGKYWRIGPNSSNNIVVTNQSGVGVYMVDGATSWTGNSDENLKENITSLGTVGDKLKNYRTSYFNWKYDNRETPKRQIGFIAQDWETDFPEVVNKMEGEPLGMQYTETIPILLKYIQELEARIETLEG